MKQYLMIFSNASVNRSRYCLMQKMCPHMHLPLPTHTHARARAQHGCNFYFCGWVRRTTDFVYITR